jgi:hypothetical protein
VWLLLQGLRARARTLRRRLLYPGLSLTVISFRALPSGLLGFARAGWSKRNTGAPRFTQTDSDRLLRRTCTVLTFPYMFDFFVDEFSGCGGWRFAFAQIFLCAFDYFLFRPNSCSFLPS